MTKGLAVSVTTDGNKTVVNAPYHPDFPRAARKIGGDWKVNQWVFDARDEERVRELCRTVYGTDNSSVGETVSVRYDLWAATGSIRTPDHWAFGRCVARRRGRDSNVELGPQVVVLEGGFESRGGSVKNPDLAPVEGTVVEIRDIPAGHIDVETDTNILEVIRPAPHVIALRAEHAKLTARLAEIDAILEQEAGDA